MGLRGRGATSQHRPRKRPHSSQLLCFLSPDSICYQQLLHLRASWQVSCSRTRCCCRCTQHTRSLPHLPAYSYKLLRIDASGAGAWGPSTAAAAVPEALLLSSGSTASNGNGTAASLRVGSTTATINGPLK